jgi:UDP:flavonoid glycosyltransferase YjiC (YdhE family)
VTTTAKDEGADQVARYLLAASPLRGHLMPMMTLGRELQRLGNDITLLTGAEYVDGVTAAGLDAVALPDRPVAGPPSVPAVLRGLPAPVRRFWVGRTELAAVYVDPMGEQAAALRALLAERPVDAVIADMTFTGALPLLLGDADRPPVLVCCVGPLTLSSADTPPFGVAWQPRPGQDYRRMTAVAHRVLMRGTQRRFDRALRAAGAAPSPVFLADWPRLADSLMQMSVAGFEYPRSDLPDHVEFAGPLLPLDTTGFVEPPWWGELATASTVVLVTQGTYDNSDLDQLITPALEGLGDAEGVLVVVTTGGRPGQRRPRSAPANARIAEWVPYSALMPFVDVMITNGGYGGVQYALSHGVPLVVAGETSDKAEVAARVDYTGVGIDLGTATPSPEALRAAVHRIGSDPRYRRAAGRLRAEIAEASPVDSIVNALKRCAEA